MEKRISGFESKTEDKDSSVKGHVSSKNAKHKTFSKSGHDGKTRPTNNRDRRRRRNLGQRNRKYL